MYAPLLGFFNERITMLHLKHAYYQYADTPLLKDIDFSVNKGDVIALIGENGAGKTTLLKLLLGELLPDEGHLVCKNEVIGYIPQVPAHQTTTVEKSFGDTPLWRIEYALSTTALNPEISTQQVSSLSGGQKTRLALAQVLASDPEPTILLLDEPTNNIDAEGLMWLQQFVQSFQGAIVIVSHDRSFINTVATKVIELKQCTLKQYGGNYDFYLEQRSIEQEKKQREYQSYLDEKAKLEKLVRTVKRDAKHGTRRKKSPDNDKMLWTFKNEHVQQKAAGRGRALETRLEKLETVDRPEQLQRYTFVLSGEAIEGKKIIELKQISKLFGDQLVLQNIAIVLRGGQRLHVQGKNGSGKSTLLKIMAGHLDPDGGTRECGTNVRVGYFSQEVDMLSGARTARENLAEYCEDATQLYRAASHFGLNSDDLKRLPCELSRGQQAKLAFTKLLLGDFQLLILDEPTNHLDIPTKEQLESALRDYRGTLVVASHDSYFMKEVNCTRTITLNST